MSDSNDYMAQALAILRSTQNTRTAEVTGMHLSHAQVLATLANAQALFDLFAAMQGITDRLQSVVDQLQLLSIAGRETPQ